MAGSERFNPVRWFGDERPHGEVYPQGPSAVFFGHRIGLSRVAAFGRPVVDHKLGPLDKTTYVARMGQDKGDV